jgi:hypothetical protein
VKRRRNNKVTIEALRCIDVKIPVHARVRRKRGRSADHWDGN